MRKRFLAAASTHVGRVRRHNEDTYVCEADRGLFAVIDGMGGEQAGEVAARITAEALAAGANPRESIQQANTQVFERAQLSMTERGMGCVVTAAQVRGNTLHIHHVGDTRAYIAGHWGCEQMTLDHTLIAELQEQLGMSNRQAERMPNRHQVTRDVGGDAEVEIDHYESDFEPGDLLLLCSDGLHDHVPNDELFTILSQARKDLTEPQQLVNSLTAMALSRGGRDNVTMVAVRCLRRAAEEEGDGGKQSRTPVSRTKTPKKAGSRITSNSLKYYLLGALLTVVTAGLVFLIGGGEKQQGSELKLVQGLVQAEGGELLGAGEAGLAGRLNATGRVTATGPLSVQDLHTESVVSAGAQLDLRGAEIIFPVLPSQWRIRLEEGASLELSQASIRAPKLSLKVIFEGPGAEFVLRDSHVSIEQLSTESKGGESPWGVFRVEGGHFESQQENTGDPPAEGDE